MKNLITLILALFILQSCSTSMLEKISENGETAKKAPYLLVISIDGYRHDYTQTYRPSFLYDYITKGASRVKSLRPSFPTKTFPNHLTIMTGLYPEKHGIVANHFYNKELKREYRLSDKSAVTNSKFYRGIPLWSLAESQQMRSAIYFWPGSEAKIAGHLPSFWSSYDPKATHEMRVKKVKKWLSIEKNKRPHLMALYFSDVDTAGHRFGPNSLEVKEAITKVDQTLLEIFRVIKKSKLPINLVITSDHGMAPIYKKVVLKEKLSARSVSLLKNYTSYGHGPLVHFYFKEDQKRDQKSMSIGLVHSMNSEQLPFKAYLREDIPKRFHFSKDPNIGDIVIIANKGVSVSLEDKELHPGNHGYDNNHKTMHGIFYASGPNIKKDVELGTVDNIHIYPFLAKLLNLEINHEIDGELRYLLPLYKESLNSEQ
ncbi:ectonucleotide pyrophosphatase/phosphodiesterase [Halobacteriovorax sp. GB3]|uniref:alkaline phosphatase family protein n=1 Tax=Halobacteriovorax sp. GB3 TaxID=2719615 RepID=UPI0023628895|nr:ectonucleotide pyrophosphatase/phosphodiesterase [Halobacteriovorax sp. GB3]MDD0853288.1 ectonucleotide pyrophosphatase/phosphodiesterase [Halobacteriovorax sp. GB3]